MLVSDYESTVIDDNNDSSKSEYLYAAPDLIRTVTEKYNVIPTGFTVPASQWDVSDLEGIETQKIFYMASRYSSARSFYSTWKRTHGFV